MTMSDKTYDFLKWVAQIVLLLLLLMLFLVLF